jgi:hypothetical protein
MSGKAVLAGVAAALGARAALAQAPPATPPPKPPPAVQTTTPVVITAQRPPVVNAIDRTTYNLSDDPQSQTGTAADVLRDLPLVDVDIDGNPSLRGDSGVQILLNGQPTTMLNGPGRGAILQSMGADMIDSIEVITAPSAMFRPDGSAGVINIITKKGYKPGPTSTVRVSGGTEGRYNAGVTGSYAWGATDLHAGYNLRDAPRKRRSVTVRDDVDSATGLKSDSDQTSISNGDRFSQNLWAGADHDIGGVDHLSADLAWDDRRGSDQSFERDRSDTAPSDQSRSGVSEEHGWDESLDARYKHDFVGEGHQFTLRLEASRNDDDSVADYRYGYALPPGPPTAGDQTASSREVEQQLTAEYVWPMAGGAKLQAGYSLQHDDNFYANGADGVDPTSGARTPNPAMNNDFTYGQWIHALYGTYGRPLGKLQVQLGLRLEDVAFHIDSQTGGVMSDGGYVRLYPSLHMSYPISATGNLKADYTQRISRPGPDDLNPFVVVQDAFNQSAGNPRLTPQVTHAMELGWQDNGPKSSKAITLYWRQTEDTITGVSRQVSPTVLLSTQVNQGGLRSTGADAFASFKPSDRLSYTLSAYVFDNQVRPATRWFVGPRLDFGYSAKLIVNWRPTSADTVQWTGAYASRRLTSTGYRQAAASADVGYRHDLTGRLGAVLTVSDLFDSRGDKVRANAADAHDLYDRSQLGRTVMLGLSYRLGGGGGAKRAPDQRFTY